MKRLLAIVLVLSLSVIACSSEKECTCPDTSEREAELEAKIAELEGTIEEEKQEYEAEIEGMEKTISSLEWKLEQAIKSTPEPAVKPSPTPSPSVKPTPSPTLIPEATLIPSSTPIPTPEPTSTPLISGSPFARVLSSALSYREGPDTEYETIGQFDFQDDLYLIGQFNNCRWLKVTTEDEKTGWILSDNAFLQDLNPIGPCHDIPNGTFSLFTQIIESDIQGDGDGELSVDNNLETDVLIVLKNTESSGQMAAYIRSGESINEKNIDDGDYNFYFTTGIEWDDEAKEFTRQAEYRQFWYLPSFTTTASTHTELKITLISGPAGEVPGSQINPDQFPDIGD